MASPASSPLAVIVTEPTVDFADGPGGFLMQASMPTTRPSPRMASPKDQRPTPRSSILGMSQIPALARAAQQARLRPQQSNKQESSQGVEVAPAESASTGERSGIEEHAQWGH